MSAPNHQDISQLDLAFCVDLTRSMEPFIYEARRHMSNMLRALSGSAQANLQTALVGYRDYTAKLDPQLVLYRFSPSQQETQRALDSLAAFSSPDNTDAAEAVFAGLQSCVQQLSWRPMAFKIVILVGDAPPHGCGITYQPHADRFTQKDPTGYDTDSMGAFLEGNGVTLYSLSMLPSSLPAHDALTEKAFSQLASLTGGEYRRATSSQDAIAIVEAIGKKVFGELEFDRYLFEELTRSGMIAPGAPMPAPAAISEFLSTKMPSPMSNETASASVARLSKRGILKKDNE